MKPYCTDRSLAHFENLKTIVPGGVYSNFRFKPDAPLFFQSALGTRLIDLDGNEYLDLYGRSGAAFLGHNNPRFLDYYKFFKEHTLLSEERADFQLISMLTKYIPSAEMIRFSLSGSAAVQNALRVARGYTARKKVLRFEGHYHGNYDNVLGGSYNKDTFPKAHLDESDPHYSLGSITGCVGDQMIIIPWNDLEILEDTLQSNGEEIAAVITEPISVNAGSIMPIDGYLQSMRKLCTRYGCILIFDEVITGFRMGLGGAQTVLDVTPDMTVLGKVLGGGELPVSAVVGKKEIMRLYEEQSVIYGGTFNGYWNGLCAAAATFKTLEDSKDQYFEMNHVMKNITNIIKQSASAHGLPLWIQGPDSCISFHHSRGPIQRFDQLNDVILLSNSIIRACMQSYGILSAPPSRLYPSILLNKQDIEFVNERIDLIMKNAATIIPRVLNSKSLMKPYLRRTCLHDDSSQTFTL